MNNAINPGTLIRIGSQKRVLCVMARTEAGAIDCADSKGRTVKLSDCGTHFIQWANRFGAFPRTVKITIVAQPSQQAIEA